MPGKNEFSSTLLLAFTSTFLGLNSLPVGKLHKKICVQEAQTLECYIKIVMQCLLHMGKRVSCFQWNMINTIWVLCWTDSHATEP